MDPGFVDLFFAFWWSYVKNCRKFRRQLPFSLFCSRRVNKEIICEERPPWCDDPALWCDMRGSRRGANSNCCLKWKEGGNFIQYPPSLLSLLSWDLASFINLRFHSIAFRRVALRSKWCSAWSFFDLIRPPPHWCTRRWEIFFLSFSYLCIFNAEKARLNSLKYCRSPLNKIIT